MFESIFKDMLGGKELPLLTRFLLSARVALTGLGMAFPVIAFAALRFRLSRSVCAMAVLAFLAMLELVVVWQGLVSPILMVISEMQEPTDIR